MTSLDHGWLMSGGYTLKPSMVAQRSYTFLWH